MLRTLLWSACQPSALVPTYVSLTSVLIQLRLRPAGDGAPEAAAVADGDVGAAAPPEGPGRTGHALLAVPPGLPRRRRRRPRQHLQAHPQVRRETLLRSVLGFIYKTSIFFLFVNFWIKKRADESCTHGILQNPGSSIRSRNILFRTRAVGVSAPHMVSGLAFTCINFDA